MQRFKSLVEEHYGAVLAEPEPEDIHGFDDHMGWREQGDGLYYYGLNIENGRLADNEQHQLKSAIREICRSHGIDPRAAALQYPLQHPAVASVIPGVWREKEVAANLELFQTEIPDLLWDHLASEGLARRIGV